MYSSRHSSKVGKFVFQFAMCTILTGARLVSFQQESHALDFKGMADEMATRGLCALLGLTTGQCAPKPQNPMPPTIDPTTTNPPELQVPPSEYPPTTPPEIQQLTPDSRSLFRIP